MRAAGKAIEDDEDADLDMDVEDDLGEGDGNGFVLPSAEEREKEKEAGTTKMPAEIQKRMQHCVRILGNFKKLAEKGR